MLLLLALSMAFFSSFSMLPARTCPTWEKWPADSFQLLGRWQMNISNRETLCLASSGEENNRLEQQILVNGARRRGGRNPQCWHLPRSQGKVTVPRGSSPRAVPCLCGSSHIGLSWKGALYPQRIYSRPNGVEVREDVQLQHSILNEENVGQQIPLSCARKESLGQSRQGLT